MSKRVLSDDFLKAAQHFKLVIGVIGKLIRETPFNKDHSINVIPLENFARYTYVTSYQFKNAESMRRVMVALSSHGIGVDEKSTELKRFRVCLALPIDLAKQELPHLERQIDQMSPAFENQPREPIVPLIREEEVVSPVGKVDEEHEEESPSVDVPTDEENVADPETSERSEVEAGEAQLFSQKLVDRLVTEQGFGCHGHGGRPPFGSIGRCIVMKDSAEQARGLFTSYGWYFREVIPDTQPDITIFRFFSSQEEVDAGVKVVKKSLRTDIPPSAAVPQTERPAAQSKRQEPEQDGRLSVQVLEELKGIRGQMEELGLSLSDKVKGSFNALLQARLELALMRLKNSGIRFVRIDQESGLQEISYAELIQKVEAILSPSGDM